MERVVVTYAERESSGDIWRGNKYKFRQDWKIILKTNNNYVVIR